MVVKRLYVITMLIVVYCSYAFAGTQKASTILDFIKPSLELVKGDTGLSGVDQIYVINLDIRYHKWLNTYKQLEIFGLAPQRVSGINGWLLDRRKVKKIYKSCIEKEHYKYLNLGQTGCFLSHLSILHHAFIEQYRCVWILEDDILVLNNLIELSDVIEKLYRFDPEWDVLFTDVNPRGMCFEEVVIFEQSLGNEFNYTLVYDPNFSAQENEDFKRIQCRLCTHSMLISSRGIKKLLDYFQSIKIAFPIDIQMHGCPNKRFYVSKKEYVTNGARETSDTSSRPHL